MVLFYVRGGLASFVVASPFGSRCPGRPFARSIVIPRDRFWASYYLYAVAVSRTAAEWKTGVVGHTVGPLDRSLVRSLGGISRRRLAGQGRAALKNGGLAFRFLQSRTRFMMQ